MGYQDRFTAEEIADFEEKLLEQIGKNRTDFHHPLWEDGRFVYEVLPYFGYKSDFWILDEFLSEKFYDNMLIVCAVIENLRAVHNYMMVPYVLEKVPKHAWYDTKFMFLHNVVCADVTALEFVPDELKTSEVIMNGIYQVPRQQDFYEADYIIGYKKVLDCAPLALWKDAAFVKQVQEELCSTFTYIHREKDLQAIIEYIAVKTGE